MKIKVDIEHLEVGMYVSELDRPWLESPFLFQGFLIETEEDLSKLREHCAYVYVDEQKSRDHIDIRRFLEVRVSSVSNQQRSKISFDYKKQSTPEEFKRTISTAIETNKRARAGMIKILDDFRLGRSVNTDETRAMVSDLVSSITTNSNTTLWLTNLRKRDEYTANHCLNVTILSLAFARHLGYSIEMMKAIGEGAMLHDVGLTKVAVEILRKKDKLSDEEFSIIKKHPSDGANVLRLTGKISEQALQIIRSHHERINGSGYPDGLKDEEIPEYVMIVSIADVYDTMTSDRNYREGILPQDALTAMHKDSVEEFGNALMEEFIKCIGIYPIGSLVLLNTGALGIVMSSNPDARLKPLVLLVRDDHGKTLMPRKLVNLAAMAEKAGSRWSISRMVNPKDYGIDISAVAAEEMLFDPQ
ncbi:MAG: HD-GYP domain-containing protein [Gammaproteobacteria bacterium]|nr:HD-GYP domain-containing protein [Gammaproteobacteria bacterium]